MNSDPTPQLEPQFIRLTENQASLLEQLGPTSEGIALAEEFGAIALKGNVELVAVVVDHDEHGNETPRRLVALGDDLGTTIRTDGVPRAEENRARYGTVEEAYAQLIDQEKSKTGEDSPEKSSEELIMDVLGVAGIENALNTLDVVRNEFNQNRLLSQRETQGMADKLRGIGSALQRAAEEGPMTGNRLQNYPQVMQQIEQLTDEAQQLANKSQERGEQFGEKVMRTGGQYSEHAQTASQKLKEIDDPAAFTLTRALGEIEEHLLTVRKTVLTYAQNESEQWRLSASMLGNLYYDSSHLTVDDAQSMLYRLMTQLQETPLGDGVARAEVDLLEERVGSLRRLIKQ